MGEKCAWVKAYIFTGDTKGGDACAILCSSLSTWLLFDYSESSFFQYFVTIHDAKIQFIELRLHVYVYTAR